VALTVCRPAVLWVSESAASQRLHLRLRAISLLTRRLAELQSHHRWRTTFPLLLACLRGKCAVHSRFRAIPLIEALVGVLSAIACWCTA